MKVLALATLSVLAVALPAQAAVQIVTPGVNGDYVEQAPVNPTGPGVYGVEVRSGKPGAQDWEIGVGRGTSQPGQFNQGQYAWTQALAPFTLTWTPTGLTFNLNGVVVTDAGKSAPLTGNTLKVFVKGQAVATIASVDGVAFNQSLVGGQTLYLYSANGFGGDGFTVTGTMRMRQGGANGVGGSTDAVVFKNGVFNAVPEPATWALMIGGFGLAGAALRRRRRVRAA